MAMTSLAYPFTHEIVDCPEKLRKVLECNFGYTPESLEQGLLQAGSIKNIESVRLLLEYGLRLTRRSFFEAFIKVNCNHSNIMQEFLNYGLNIDEILCKLSLTKLPAYHTSYLPWLLEHGANPNVEYIPPGSEQHGFVRSPLVEAFEDAYLESVELLFSHGAELDVYTIFEIITSSFSPSKGWLKGMRYLISQGIDFNSWLKDYQATYLHDALLEAAKMGEMETVKALFEVGGDPNRRIGEGFTATELLAIEWAKLCDIPLGSYFLDEDWLDARLPPGMHQRWYEDSILYNKFLGLEPPQSAEFPAYYSSKFFW